MNDLSASYAVSYSGASASVQTANFFMPVYPASPPLSPKLTSNITLGNAITEVLKAKAVAQRRPRTLKALKHYLGLFARGRESMPLADVTVETLERWFESRTEKPSTKKSNLGRLSSLLQFAVKRRWIAENPVRQIDAPSLDREPPKTLTVEECDVLLHWALHNKPVALAWFVLTLLVGLRPESEADSLTWEQIDLERGRIRVAGAGSKVRSHRIIDLNLTPAVPWLKMAKEIGSRLPLPYSTRRKYLREARGVLGWWAQDCLRHSAASYLLAKHQDAGKTAYILGNSATIVHRHYKALIEPEDAERWFALLPHEPEQAASVVQRAGVEAPRRSVKILTVDQCGTLLRCIQYQKPKALTWIVLTLLCGITESEGRRIGWDDIDLTDGLIHVANGPISKRKARIIQLPENVRLWLVKAKELGAPLPIQPNRGRFSRYVCEFLSLKEMPWLCLRDSCVAYHVAYQWNVKRHVERFGMTERTLNREFRGLVSKTDADAFFALKPL